MPRESRLAGFGRQIRNIPFPPPSRGLVSYDSVSDSFDEVGRDDGGRLSGGSVDVFPDTEIPRPQV